MSQCFRILLQWRGIPLTVGPQPARGLSCASPDFSFLHRGGWVGREGPQLAGGEGWGPHCLGVPHPSPPQLTRKRWSWLAAPSGPAGLSAGVPVCWTRPTRRGQDGGVAFCAWTERRRPMRGLLFGSPLVALGRPLAGLDVTQALARRMTRSQLAQKLTSVHPACRGPRGGLAMAIWGGGTWREQPSRGLTMSRPFSGEGTWAQKIK